MKEMLIRLDDLKLAKDGSFIIANDDIEKLNADLKGSSEDTLNGNCGNGNCGGSINMDCEG